MKSLLPDSESSAFDFDAPSVWQSLREDRQVPWPFCGFLLRDGFSPLHI